MSDNGSGGGEGGKGGAARGQRAGLAGGKGGVWEGGIRSPLIIRGPGVPANSWCHERVVGYDFYSTYCEWAGVPSSKLPRNIEGGSIVGLLDDGNGTVKRQREELVFHFPHYQGGDGPHSALFLGNHKLMKFYEDNRLALFDIKILPCVEFLLRRDKGLGRALPHFRFQVSILFVRREAVPFIGIFPEVVEFFTVIAVTNVAPVAIDDRVFSGIHVRPPV